MLTKGWLNLRKISIHVLGMTLGLSLLLSSQSIHADALRTTLEYGNGITYFGETKNGKPNGYGVMTWGKSKTYKGNWVDGKRSGKGTYRVVTRREDSLTNLVYDGYWTNDKKEGKGELRITETSLTGEMREDQIKTGTFNKDQWISGYDVRHGEYDPPYYFAYKDSKMTLKILGEAGDILNGLKKGYFFSFTYQKGKVVRDVGVGDEYSQKQFSSFIKNIEKEIKPYIDHFEKLAMQL